MYDLDENFDLEKSEEVKKKLHGKPYVWRDVYYCIFENAETFPHSLSFLCRIKVMTEEGGVVYCTNSERRTYKEIYADKTIILDAIYRNSKRKILMRSKLTLGWEGRILNDARYC